MSDMNVDFSREERNCFDNNNQCRNCYDEIVDNFMKKYKENKLENRMDREN